MNTEQFIKDNTAELFGLVRELCGITAPSNDEGRRAAYCKTWLENMCAKGVYIDGALNVVYPVNIGDSREITVFAAHTDTVFPDTEPMPYREENGNIYSPGIGDDTASLAVLMMLAKYYTQNGITPKNGVLFVCNSGEEGLGNLKGVKKIFSDYEGRIASFVSFDDGNFAKLITDAVGSHRYEVTVKTPGGHSYGAFGNKNALHEISKMVTKIYGITPPDIDGIKTTYNVGEISGGTSINTIAEEAKMLCEYRSGHKDALAIMKSKFEAIFEEARFGDVSVDVKLIGERPCADIDSAVQTAFADMVAEVMEAEGITEVRREFGSTDSNIPLSLGIPAVTLAVYTGGKSHTRDEWVEKASIPKGLARAIALANKLM